MNSIPVHLRQKWEVQFVVQEGRLHSNASVAPMTQRNVTQGNKYFQEYIQNGVG